MSDTVKQVLIVDDDSMQRVILNKHLSRYGFSAAECQNGKEALDLFAKSSDDGGSSPYDLIIMDYIMNAGPDGICTSKEILKLYPQQEIIICSGHQADDLLRDAKDLGVGWLAKPYTRDQLYEVINERLNKKHPREH